jgi:hypothetical protein
VSILQLVHLPKVKVGLNAQLPNLQQPDCNRAKPIKSALHNWHII